LEHQRSEISGKERKKERGGSVGGQEGKKLEGKKKQMRRYLAGKKTKIWKWNTPRKKKE